jgi:hypothetical protein
VAELGRLDIVSASDGPARSEEITEATAWDGAKVSD